MNRIARHACFQGWQDIYQHSSVTLGCAMNVAVYLPPQAETRKLPVLYWLSGLTCSDQNFVTKAGAQGPAAELGIAIVAPDTSPRGEQVADDPSWDLGQGAGFYVNARREPWAPHYRMYDYILSELPQLLGSSDLPLDLGRAGISGHSMGGHGALTMALKNPGRFRSVSAFAPICAPSRCPWGERAFGAYLGEERALWREHDASELIGAARERLPLLVDQGEADQFLAEQLRPELLEEACAAHGHPLTLRRQPGYDHSYYFIASFIGDHLRHHAAALTQ